MRKFFKSFKFAMAGIIHCFTTERNFKIHVSVAITVICAGLLTGLSLFEWFVIIVFIGGVLALELMNSAVERMVDLFTNEWHPLAKQAKDLAAGAVLVFALTSAIVGLLIFIPKWFSLTN
ncbi:diacylglycerol kinase family protein [Sporosarcina pasteurii]|uniref:Undecaprenol kinase n=1 Tax=Sporosarcina pasteurii TaxID=1474 RepID=A0A380BPX8_SPOPA|nr:diacylglycerol kinase family protein [Sporosarcina pasteurii]MDS9471032.1 diacylglycerol kinase family protein [Sporosarcina pasteurii]QBQ05322.1 diacylglycerol kinase family protein [Sporosarcina pasteurii]SUJ04053.1 Undecaprenol kinase [Sporosarcina pasteurii]